MTMALAITITMKAVPEVKTKPRIDHRPPGDELNKPDAQVLMPSKRVSRFLAGNTVVGTNPRAAPQAADHCKDDNTICNILGGKCCHNKCMDLSLDKNNCGTCKKKCKFTHTCCRGECVMLAFHKSHCGKCNNPCPKGQYCVYGMCSYA
ncbi:hypothetical protein CRG98_015495 [Punica granatum]|nr:hypothetical protein CRG98_015495 [Punica granatum]